MNKKHLATQRFCEHNSLIDFTKSHKNVYFWLVVGIKWCKAL